jgi:DNA polymerase (family 10)
VPCELDLDRVLKTARQHEKAVEINAYPQRLDLNDVQARRAHELGTLVAIDSDTHVLDHLGNLELGVATARRGWIEKTEVLNTRPATELVSWVQRIRGDRSQRRAPVKGPRSTSARAAR